MSTTNTNTPTIIGAVVGTAILLTVVYFAARVASAGWNAGK